MAGDYTEHEIAVLTKEIEAQRAAQCSRFDFHVIAAKLPGRTVAGLSCKASKLGLTFRVKNTSKKAIKRRVVRATARKPERKHVFPAVVIDKLFQTIMKDAIANGTERAKIGVVSDPGTYRPRAVCPEPRVAIRSNALAALQIGEPTTRHSEKAGAFA
jgi:hypothetical protein